MDDELLAKRCLDCGVEKPPSEFWKRKASADGLSLYCKACFTVRNTRSSEERAAREGRTVRRQKSRAVPVDPGTKFCPSCEQVLPVEEFVRNRSTRTGLGTYCRPCQNEKSAESIARLHGNTRHYHLRRRYGLGADDVLRMLEEQARRCALCFRDVSAATVHVDHDHVTGKVRGLVCFNCNGGLGQFKDNAAVVRRAADYLDGQHLRLRREQPGVVRLVYPEPTETEVLPEPSDRPQLLDIAALRAKARGA